MPHLQDRPEDWIEAEDQEWIDALLDHPPLIDPRFVAHAERCRPHCLRRALLLHKDMGGYLGAPARRWLKGGR